MRSQAAAGLCLSRTNPNVEVEHWLVKLVEAANTDLTRIFRHFEVDPARLLRDLTKVMDQFRTGNQRTPTLSTTDRPAHPGRLGARVDPVPGGEGPLGRAAPGAAG